MSLHASHWIDTDGQHNKSYVWNFAKFLAGTVQMPKLLNATRKYRLSSTTRVLPGNIKWNKGEGVPHRQVFIVSWLCNIMKFELKLHVRDHDKRRNMWRNGPLRDGSLSRSLGFWKSRNDRLLPESCTSDSQLQAPGTSCTWVMSSRFSHKRACKQRSTITKHQQKTIHWNLQMLLCKAEQLTLNYYCVHELSFDT